MHIGAGRDTYRQRWLIEKISSLENFLATFLEKEREREAGRERERMRDRE